MRIFFLFIFTAIVGLQSIQGFLTLVNWKINQKEITERYCENKEKLNMHCDGKCYLAKQLKLQEDNEKSDLEKNQSPKFKKIKETQLFDDLSQISITFSAEPSTKTENFKNQNQLYSFEKLNSCFQPPQV